MEDIMKKMMSYSIRIFLVLTICLSLSACGQAVSEADVWLGALYTENTELGSGSKTLSVDVVAMGKTVTFTLHTDKETLGEALVEHNLIEGEMGAYGLYVKKVNGIVADYDVNQCYWGLNKNGESLMTGVDGAEIRDGEHYELVYIK